MMHAGKGLSPVKTDDLKRLLKAVHGGELIAPFNRKELTRFGFFHLADELDLLRGLDERAVRAVLVGVLAERAAQEARS